MEDKEPSDDRNGSSIASVPSMPSSSSSERVRIAIIGASYAGLTLANLLQQHNKSNAHEYSNDGDPQGHDDCDNSKASYYYDCTVFESKVPPFSYIIGGDFNVPSYPMILDRIQLQHHGKGDRYERKDVIDTLRRKCIEKNSIVYGKNVISIEQERVEELQEKNSDYTTCSASESESTRACRRHVFLNAMDACVGGVKGHNSSPREGQHQRYGPYDIIVGANGVKSFCRKIQCSSEDRIYLIGDARWANDRFYDMGYRRIEQGADLAMRDALELGQYIIHYCEDAANQLDETLTCGIGYNQKCAMEKKFHARFVRIRQFRRRIFLFILFVALLARNFIL